MTFEATLPSSSRPKPFHRLNGGDMQGELKIVWHCLLPAFHSNRLEANKEEHASLKVALANRNARPKPSAKRAIDK